MSEELQKNPSSQEEEIDLLELALKVWGERKFILKACGYAVLIGLVIVFSIPREYTAEAMIAPELSDNKGTCLLYTSPSPRDRQKSRMPSSA